MRFALTLIGMALVMLSLNIKATDVSGLRFTHGDWELVCDNTRTCRAAGYQRDEDDFAVSVLLTRKAGPHEPVTGELKFGQYDADTPLPGVGLALHINGEIIGQVETLPSLAPDLIAALLPALLRDSIIEWVSGEHRWRLSDTGATAVLLKMDDFQGRIDTPGALVRKGPRSEDEVLPSLPPPVVIAAPVPKGPESKRALTTTESDNLLDALRATISDEDYCPGLTDDLHDDGTIMAYRLSETRLLVSTPCWSAAYNVGDGYWVVNETPPYYPVLVIDFGSDYIGGTISAAHKSRGLGDCWSINDWTWDGEQFIRTSSYTTGMCKLIEAGGAWTLPTIVTEIRRTSESSTAVTE